MMDVIFARTRHVYQSYTDFWRLVELSGFPTCYVDEIDPTDASACYIFTPKNGEIPDGWPDAKAKIIHWNIEQDVYPDIPGVAETWYSDATLAQMGNGRYVLMGSHPDLAQYVAFDKTTYARYDFIALAYWTHRRQCVRDRMIARGFQIAPNAWGDMRCIHLELARYMLHIHQNDGKPYLAPQRWCIAAAYQMPLITETLENWGAFPRDTMTEYSYNELRYGLTPERLNGRDTGAALHQFLCVEHPFRRCVEAVV